MADIEDEYHDYFEGLSDAARERVAEALRKEADDLVEAQKEALRAQLQPPEESGNLEESIQVIEAEDDTHLIVQAGGEATTHGYVDYAELFEFGSRHQPARPFFFPTYRERREQIEENVRKAVAG